MGMWRRKELLPHLFLHLLQHLALGSNLLLDGVVDIEESPLTAVLVGFLQCSHQLQPPLIRVFLPAFVLFLQVLVLSLFSPDHLLLQHLQPGEGEHFSELGGLRTGCTSVEDARPSMSDIWEDTETWEL